MNFDPDEFKDTVDYFEHMRSQFAERDAIMDRMKAIYFLEDEDAERLRKAYDAIPVTISPDPANAVETAVRLMTANSPDYNVPEELHADGANRDTLDEIEKLAAMMMRASDRVRGTPVHVDGARSGLIYDEIIISVNCTENVLTDAKGASKAALKRIERIKGITPFLFDVTDPHGCYYDIDSLGLRAFGREVTMTGQQVIESWGSDGREAVGIDDETKARNKEYVVRLMWDLVNYTVWVQGSSQPIVMRPHNLPFIPWVVHTVEGSRLFPDADEQRRPFLYNIDKSGLWRRQNLSLTAVYSGAQSRMFAAFVYNANPEDDDPMFDLTQPINTVRISRENKLTPLPADPAQNSTWQALQLAQQLGEQSTIYRTVGGQPVGPGATFSETALLNQAGRLPLTAIQRKLGWALGDALRIAFLWMKENGGSYNAKDRGAYASLKATDIPDDLEVEVTLNLALPQDRLQQANIFQILKDRVPDEYLYEELLHIRRPGEMRNKLWKQRIEDTLAGAQLQQLVAEASAPPPQAMPQTPPDMQGGGMPGPVGLPPEMMQGGMAGPEAPAFEQGGMM